MFLALQLAWRNVLRNRERSLLTLIGVLLAIGSFVALLSLAEGLSRRVQEEFDARDVDLYILPGRAVFLPTGPIGTLGLSGDTLSPKLLDACANLSNVARAEGIVRDTWTGTQTLIPVLSLRMAALPSIFPNLRGGAECKGNQLLLGAGAAQAEYPNGVIAPLRHGQTDYEVVATVKGAGFQDYFAFLPLEAVPANGYHEAWIQLKDKPGAIGTRDEIVRELQKLGITGVTVLTRSEYLQRCGDYVHYARVLQFSVSAIGILISITAAMNTMLMSTYERLREFAILRAVGASRATVALMITAESIILCSLGGILGLLFGLLASGVLDKTVIVLLQLPFPLARVTPVLVLEALALAAFIGVVGAIMPAVIVTRLKLIDGLRWD